VLKIYPAIVKQINFPKYNPKKNKHIYKNPSQKLIGNKCALKIINVAIKEKLTIKPIFMINEAKLFCKSCSLFCIILKED
jgi:hypothetical protein